ALASERSNRKSGATESLRLKMREIRRPREARARCPGRRCGPNPFNLSKRITDLFESAYKFTIIHQSIEACGNPTPRGIPDLLELCLCKHFAHGGHNIVNRRIRTDETAALRRDKLRHPPDVSCNRRYTDSHRFHY